MSRDVRLSATSPHKEKDMRGNRHFYSGLVAGFVGACCSAAFATSVPLNDASFEQASGALPNPLLLPPLTGQIGGWDLSRGGIGALTGLTVPRMFIDDSAAASDGDQIAAITFIAGVLSHAEFRQTLNAEYAANSCYTLTVDVGHAGLADVLAAAAIR